VPLSPRHVNIAIVVITTSSSTLVRNMKRKTDWYGGNRARADFHVTPPFGRSIVKDTPAALAFDGGELYSCYRKSFRETWLYPDTFGDCGSIRGRGWVCDGWLLSFWIGKLTAEGSGADAGDCRGQGLGRTTLDAIEEQDSEREVSRHQGSRDDRR
jgi:hypothetical protein